MGANADSIRARDLPPGTTPPGHIFQVFRQWPRVPTADLLLLKNTLQRCVAVAGSSSAHALLALVNEELARRSTPQPATPAQAPAADKHPRTAADHPKPAA